MGRVSVTYVSFPHALHYTEAMDFHMLSMGNASYSLTGNVSSEGLVINSAQQVPPGSLYSACVQVVVPAPRFELEEGLTSTSASVTDRDVIKLIKTAERGCILRTATHLPRDTSVQMLKDQFYI